MTAVKEPSLFRYVSLLYWDFHALRDASSLTAQKREETHAGSPPSGQTLSFREAHLAARRAPQGPFPWRVHRPVEGSQGGISQWGPSGKGFKREKRECTPEVRARSPGCHWTGCASMGRSLSEPQCPSCEMGS